MKLIDEIAIWDKRSVHIVRDIYKRYHNDKSFLTGIIDMMISEPLQNAATWLLKYHLSNKSNKLSETQINAVYKTTPHLKDWQSRLHILQIMALMPVPENRRKETEGFVRSSMTSDIKFVRAWSYDGFYQLALQYPQYRHEAEVIFKNAHENDPAGSVKSRLRNILKIGFNAAD